MHIWIANNATFIPADNEDSDQTARADLSLRWAQVSEGTFPQGKGHIITIKCLVNVKIH